MSGSVHHADKTVQWPGQPLPRALDAARLLNQHGLGRDFYHPFQTRLSGTTRAELTLLAELAGCGDWLADDTLHAMLLESRDARRLAERERVLLTLEPNDTSPENIIAFGSWLRQFGSTAHGASHFWHQTCDERVQAMLARLAAKPRAAPGREDLARMPPDIVRDLLVLSRDGTELMHQARVWQLTDPGAASDLFYQAGLAFLDADDGDSAASCLASAAALGHECAALTYLQQRSAHSQDEGRLRQLVAEYPRPAQALVLALAQCCMRRARRDGELAAQTEARKLLLGNDDCSPDVRVFGTALVRMGFWTEDMLQDEMSKFQAMLADLASGATL